MFVKRKILANKNSIKKCSPKIKFVEKNFRKRKETKEKNSKKILQIISEIFLYLNKTSLNFRKKKIEKNVENNFCNFLIFWKKSR